MFPAWIRFGPFDLPTYATLLSVGMVGGVLISAWQGARRGVSATRAFDAALLGVGGGLVGARLTYVALHWSFFRHHLTEAVRLWEGGLAWQGGLVVALALVPLLVARLRDSRGRLLDALAFGLAWFNLWVWLGSGAAADVYGRETFPTDGLSWTLSADLPDLYGLRAPRVNVALLGAVWGGLVLVTLWRLGSLPYGRQDTDEASRTERTWMSARVPGSLFFISLALIGLGGLLIVPWQANPVPYWFRLRLDWLFNLVLALGGLGGWLALNRASR